MPPVCNPLFNESPYITTEAGPIYFHHQFPDDFVSQGGDVDVGALQVRVALTDRIGIIATKDGFADVEFKEVLEDTDGFLSLAGGVKYAVLSQPDIERIVSVGVRYEHPIRDLRTGRLELEGNGHGFIDAFVTGATAFDKLGVQASIGSNFAIDTDKDTSFLHYSVHLDYELLPGFFPIFEFNGFTAWENGKSMTGPVLGQLDGVDLVNFGSEGRDTTCTVFGGARYKVNNHFQVGSGVEVPITDKEENTVFDLRFYVDMVFTY